MRWRQYEQHRREAYGIGYESWAARILNEASPRVEPLSRPHLQALALGLLVLMLLGSWRVVPELIVAVAGPLKPRVLFQGHAGSAPLEIPTAEEVACRRLGVPVSWLAPGR